MLLLAGGIAVGADRIRLELLVIQALELSNLLESTACVSEVFAKGG